MKFEKQMSRQQSISNITARVFNCELWNNVCVGHCRMQKLKKTSQPQKHSFIQNGVYSVLLEMIKRSSHLTLHHNITLASQQGQKQMHHVSIIEIYIFQKNTSVSLTIYLLDFISRQHVLSDYKLMYHAIFPFIQLCMTFYSIEKSPGSQTHSFSSTKLQFQCKQFFLFHLQHAL